MKQEPVPVVQFEVPGIRDSFAGIQGWGVQAAGRGRVFVTLIKVSQNYCDERYK